MCCLHYSSHQFSSGSYSGFCFIFLLFFFSRKQLYFGSEGVARDKLVFGMKKHSHVSFQILTRDSYSFYFRTKSLINTLRIVFFISLTSCLPLGFLEAHACFCDLSWPCSKKKWKKFCRFSKKNFQGQEIFKGFSIDKLSQMTSVLHNSFFSRER